MIHRNTSKTATSNLRRLKKCQFLNFKARLKVLVVIIADDLVNHSESTYVDCREDTPTGEPSLPYLYVTHIFGLTSKE